jgi:hypothetical protein
MGTEVLPSPQKRLYCARSNLALSLEGFSVTVREDCGTKAITSPPIPVLRLMRADTSVKGMRNAQLPSTSVSIRSEK